MVKGINLATHDLKEYLVKGINDSGLPIVNIRHVLEELAMEARGVEEQDIQKEIQKYQEELKTEQKKDVAKNKNSKLKKGEVKNVKDNN